MSIQVYGSFQKSPIMHRQRAPLRNDPVVQYTFLLCTTCDSHVALKMEQPNTNLMNGEEEQFNTFLSLHSAALQSSRIPRLYWKSLYYKLINEVGSVMAEARYSP